MIELFKCSKCGSPAFILDKPKENLSYIINIDITEKTKEIKDGETTVYCLECNNPEIISKHTIIQKYVIKTTENFLNEV